MVSFASRVCVTQHVQRLHNLPAELNTLFLCVCSHGCDQITTFWCAHLVANVIFYAGSVVFREISRKIWQKLRVL